MKGYRWDAGRPSLATYDAARPGRQPGRVEKGVIVTNWLVDGVLFASHARIGAKLYGGGTRLRNALLLERVPVP